MYSTEFATVLFHTTFWKQLKTLKGMSIYCVTLPCASTFAQMDKV